MNSLVRCIVAVIRIPFQLLSAIPSHEAIAMIFEHLRCDFSTAAIMVFPVPVNGLNEKIIFAQRNAIEKSPFLRTKQTATIVVTGTARQTRPAVRHAIKLPNKNMRKKPIVAEMDAHDIKIPRIDGSLKLKCKRCECQARQTSHRVIYLISPT